MESANTTSRLREAAQAAVNDYDKFMASEQTYPEYHHEAIRRLREALCEPEANSPETLEKVIGKWPGDETDEEIQQALEELS